MKQKSIFIVVGVLVLVVILWAIFRPETAFVDKKVNESSPQQNMMMNEKNPSMPQDDMYKKKDNMMMQKDSVLAKGMFHKGAHDTSGMATIHQLENGKKVLRLSDFATSNGPDVRVLLVTANDVTDSSMVTKDNSIDLGALKGNKGNQNYDIPANVDVSKYHSVTIWCQRFSVNFGTAPLDK
jgi:hypothetical protein